MRASGQALKADIALIFGVKSESKDGEACMKVASVNGRTCSPLFRALLACVRACACGQKMCMRVLCDLYAVDVELKSGRTRLGVQAIEQVIYDFLTQITARPDRKINKVLCTFSCVFQSAQDARACLECIHLTRISLSRQGLMTAVESELEQAKLTISNLKDTQMRQETILRQYAGEVCIRGYHMLFLGWPADASRLHSARVNAGPAKCF